MSMRTGIRTDPADAIRAECIIVVTTLALECRIHECASDECGRYNKLPSPPPPPLLSHANSNNRAAVAEEYMK
jgi:hypothetical protein